MSKQRLTNVRCNGIKTGYWSLARKDELCQKLGKYEDLDTDPEALRDTIRKYNELLQKHENLLQKLHEQFGEG